MRENIAASPGPGWRSQGTSLGTGAVVSEDPVKAASAWISNLGRPISSKDRAGWKEHCARLGVDAEGEATGWASLTGTGESWDRAVADLRRIFDETIGVKWTGYSVPLRPKKREVRPEDPEYPEDANKPRTEAEIQRGGRFLGYPAMPQASQGSTQDLGSSPVPTFSFHTKSAELIWKLAQSLTLSHPEALPTEIIRFAAQEIGVGGTDLTPEDLVLLQMAIEFLQNGPAGTKPRTGGTPGGPLRSTSTGQGP